MQTEFDSRLLYVVGFGQVCVACPNVQIWGYAKVELVALQHKNNTAYFHVFYTDQLMVTFCLKKHL